MQARVEKLIHYMHKDNNIKIMILFGRSLEFRCDSNSDIELYIETYEKEKKLGHIPEMDCEIDIVTDLSSDSKLYYEIDKRGLVLFER